MTLDMIYIVLWTNIGRLFRMFFLFDDVPAVNEHN